MEAARQQRLDAVASIAVRLEAETQLPARLLVAQWAVESKWGAKPVGHANYFGMKKASRHQKCCTVDTSEVIDGKSVSVKAEFADYDSLEESCRDYAWLITHGAPYASAWAAFQQSGNFESFAKAVLSTYATAQYGDPALQIAGQANVSQAIRAHANLAPEVTS